jgi:diguanylate cyclase (GGDEF)-like protein
MKSFRSQDFVCRIGGDEFAVIMVHSYVGLTDLIRRKVDTMNEVLAQGDETIPAVTISVGVAFGHQDQEKEALFKQADEALYRAKDMGKRGSAFYE